MKKCLLFIFLLSSLSAFSQYHGNVFEDSNQNGQMDAGEKKLSKIRVSDGLNVALTDNAGLFTLPGYEKTRFLFVIVPAGYKAAKSHYLPIKGQDSTYNFGLMQDASTAGDHVRMIHISDTETDIYGDWIANVRNFAENQQGSFIVHTGDICYEKGMNFHAAQVNSRSLQKPIHYAMGNHDLVKGQYGEALFESLFGPPYYSFDAGPAHFIITPMASGDYKPDYTVDQLIAWIRNDLKFTDKSRPVFIFNHNLPFTKGNFTLKGVKDSIELDKYGLKAWVYGHWHSDLVTQDSKTGIYTICTGPLNKGGIDNSPGQFLTIDIDAKGVKKIEPHYAYLKEHVAIIQPAGNHMNLLQNGKLAINANIYDTEWKVKQATAQVYNATGTRIASQLLAPNGSWNWRGEIASAKWIPGSYTIIVEAMYTNGRSTIRKQSFQLQAQGQVPLTLKWSTNIGGGVWKAAPLVVNNVLYVGTTDDAANKQCAITALNAITGNKLWRYPTKNSVKQALNYDNGILVATDMEGIVYALNAKTGKLLWQKDLGMKYLPGNLTGGIAKQGIYYTGNGKYLQAIKIQTGETLWRNTEWDIRMGSPAQITIAGEVLITGNNWVALFANDIHTGKLLWKRDDEGLRFRSGTAAYRDNLVYVAGDKILFMLDPKTGVTVKKIVTDYDLKVTAKPLVTDKLIILSTSASGVVAYDKTSLTQVWHTKVGEALVYTAPYYSPDRLSSVQTVEPTLIRAAGKLIFGASDGQLYLINESTGKLAQQVKLGAPIFADVSISNEKCYVADLSGNTYCFDLK